MTTFTQLYDSILYQTTPQAEDVGWCGYILNPAGGTAFPQSGVAIQTLFSTQYPYGIFVFCSSAPALTDVDSANQFANNVLTYLINTYRSGSVFTNYALVWLKDPNTLNANTVTSVSLSYGTYFGVKYPLSYNPSKNVELAIQSDAPCTIEDEMFHFFNTDINNPKLQLTTQFGTVFQNPVSDIYIPTSGPLTGCLLYYLTVPSRNYNFTANQSALNYYYPGEEESIAFDKLSAVADINDCFEGERF